jgi:hypothetical protein
MKRILVKSLTFTVTCIGAISLATPLAASASQGPVISHAPRIAEKPTTQNGKNSGWSSSNWSGYAITGSGFNSMTGDWIVPTVQATSKATYSSSWIGIDGYNNSSLIQTGTEQDYYSGSAHYKAWWEILPAAETVISGMTIHPGDHMHASIQNLGGGTWSINLQDVTTGNSFTTQQAYSGPQTSAEWIQEAPTVGGRVATLAKYGETTFDPGTVNGGNPNLIASDDGVMVQNGVQVSTPSTPDSDTDGFNIQYGSSAPTPPAS